MNSVNKPFLLLLSPVHQGEDFLDEPINNLDKDSAGIFKSTFKNIKKNGIIILVAHQPEIVNFCDKIYGLK